MRTALFTSAALALIASQIQAVNIETMPEPNYQMNADDMMMAQIAADAEKNTIMVLDRLELHKQPVELKMEQANIAAMKAWADSQGPILAMLGNKEALRMILYPEPEMLVNGENTALQTVEV